MILNTDWNSHNLVVIVADSYKSAIQLFLGYNILADGLEIYDGFCAEQGVVFGMRAKRIGFW
jgi:hypothetical protein